MWWTLTNSYTSTKTCTPATIFTIFFFFLIYQRTQKKNLLDAIIKLLVKYKSYQEPFKYDSQASTVGSARDQLEMLLR